MNEMTKIEGVILVSFEYPPRKLSKISDNIQKLALFLSNNNIRTWVITFDDWRSDTEQFSDNLQIIRIPFHIPNNISFLAQVMNLKPAYQSAISSILNSFKINIIHIFDWPCLLPIIPWKGKIDSKCIYTATSVQTTRDSSNTPYNNGIKTIEQMGFDIVDVITLEDDDLKNNISSNYKVNNGKLRKIPLKSRKYSEKIFEIYIEQISSKELKEVR
ncbi:MAG: hypothetical protein ACFFDW_07360 [Candidatus Thorarchaeota archaeon]